MEAGQPVENLWQDTRYAVRTMRRAPGVAAVAILSLALGIGANTAIFSLIDTLILRTLPVRQPDRLVEFLNQYPGDPPLNFFSQQSYEYFRDRSHVFSGLSGISPRSFSVRGEGLEQETVNGEYVIGNLFPLLGVEPAIGRLIAPEDDPAEAVVSWSYWRSRFNLDPAILGRRIVVEDVPVTIIGVTPREFSGLRVGARSDIWLPLSPGRLGSLSLIGRLRHGVSLREARAEMAVLFRFTLEERSRDSKDPLVRQLKFTVEPAGAGLSTELRYQFTKPLLVLMAVVGSLLFIACTNVAGMLLARGAARRREMALRVSLGASRYRLVRQVLTESLLLSTASALLGVILAYFGANELVRVIASGRRIIGLPPHIEIQVRPDMHMLLFTAGVAILTGVLFGSAPAWSAFASAPAFRPRRLFAKSLVVAQVALSVVLLSAAGLFVSYLWNLRNVNLGFERGHVLLVSLDSSRSGYDAERLSREYQELLSRLEAIPGVRSATLSGTTPINGAAASGFAKVEGFHEDNPGERRYVAVNQVAPKYFETFGTPLLAGRDFDFQDTSGRPLVAIVNQAMARYYFGQRSPIGKHVSLDHVTGGGTGEPYEIVGVVGDAKYLDLHGPAPRTIYLSAFQTGRVPSRFSLRTRVDPASVADEVRRTVRGPVVELTTLSDQVDASIVPERLLAGIAELFGGLGALLAAIGIYGLLAHTVARRIHEIGIRMALGATRAAVTWMVLADALRMVCAGLAIGAPVAFWSKGLAASLIQDLPAASAIQISFGAVAMIVVALLAAYVPARRAARVEPMEALRHE
jgi:putative ABC transport system permease protein